MVDQKSLDMLKQGRQAWNAWRDQNTDIHPDLSFADLSFAKLNLANLVFTKFRGANLRESDLRGADLSGADLSGADLSGAKLTAANLTEADLSDTDLSNAHIGLTIFCNIDLRRVKGLETIKHSSYSHIDTRTLISSKGNIPETFLRGAGLPDIFIDYVRALVSHPIEYYTCFISYSNQDEAFTRRLHADLQQHSVRCWFAPEDLKIGEKFWYRIDESIRMYDKLLVVLSKHSVNSAWVEREVTAALEKEHQSNALVLFPIKLDEAIKNCTAPWATDIRRNRHIGDFTHWKDHDSYQKALKRLLRDLKADISES